MPFPIPGLPQPNAQPSTKHFWHSEITTASPESVWQVWTDVTNWPTWDTNVEHALLTGTFTIGATGEITINGRPTTFEVDGMVEGRLYRLEIDQPISNIFIQRTMEDVAGGIKITHEVWFGGLAARIGASKYGAKMKQQLPGIVRKVKALAEE